MPSWMSALVGYTDPLEGKPISLSGRNSIAENDPGQRPPRRCLPSQRPLREVVCQVLGFKVPALSAHLL